jgi:N-acetylmuramoyl-L-alanine amidase
MKELFLGLILPFVLFVTEPKPAQAAQRPFLVVLDPGHGGHDDGTTWGRGGRRVTEKEIVLDLANEVAAQLRANRVRTILTRKEDRYVELEDRTALANRLGADVFVSIHVNSNPKKHRGRAHGAETFILNNTTDASSRRLAQLENRVLNGSKARVDLHQDQAVSLILKDLILDANLKESHRLACAIQQGVAGPNPAARRNFPLDLHDRGVKQALFYVLLGADMPSALFEAGFIDHPGDRKLLTSKSGLQNMARRMALSILSYRRLRSKAPRQLASCQVR